MCIVRPMAQSTRTWQKEHCSTVDFDVFQKLKLARRPIAGNMASHTVSAFAVPWYTARTSTNKPPVVGTPPLASWMPVVRPEAQRQRTRWQHAKIGLPKYSKKAGTCSAPQDESDHLHVLSLPLSHYFPCGQVPDSGHATKSGISKQTSNVVCQM